MASDSILTSTKKLLGLTESDESFDMDIVIHINSVFSILNQLGAGSSAGFSISDSSAIWTDFIDDDATLEFIKTYVYLKTKLYFDPPSSSSVLDSMNNQIAELESRINMAVDSG